MAVKMFFDSDKAWKFLFDHDYVFTVRVKPKGGLPVVQEVEIWRNGKATKFVGRKVPVLIFFDPVKSLTSDPDPNVILEDYAEHSGFKDADEWWAEAQRLSGKHEDWVIYYVEVGAC